MDDFIKKKLYNMLDKIESNPSNYSTISEIREAIESDNIQKALALIKSLNYKYEETNITKKLSAERIQIQNY